MGDRDPSTAGHFPCQALLNFTACPGAAGITEAQLLRCLREEVMLFFCPPGFLQGTFKSLDSHRASLFNPSLKEAVAQEELDGGSQFLEA